MISVFGSDLGEEEIAAVAECMRSQWVGFGERVEAFERKFSARLGLTSFAMVDSGSNALFMAVKLLDLPPGAEVILPSFTWVSCAQAVRMAGLQPVFCDVDLVTMNVRREDIERRITPRTGAVMVVHYAGLPVDLAPILELGFPVIEDAAHAVDSLYRGKPCGSLGRLGIFSFDAVKNLTTGEGGGITAGDASLIARAKKLRYCGIGRSGFEAAAGKAKRDRWWELDIDEPFIKMLPTNIAAAIGLVQLERLSALQERRRVIWDAYQQAFSDLPEIMRPAGATAPGDRHGLFTFCLRVPRRDELARFLLNEGIYTTLRYHPLHMNPAFLQTDRHLPNCERLNQEALSIPLHPRLTDADVGKVCSLIRRFYGRH